MGIVRRAPPAKRKKGGVCSELVGGDVDQPVKKQRGNGMGATPPHCGPGKWDKKRRPIRKNTRRGKTGPEGPKPGQTIKMGLRWRSREQASQKQRWANGRQKK